MPSESLEMLRNADISACNTNELIDLRNVTVRREAPFSERAGDYIRQVRNPYLFRVGSTAVKVEFSNGRGFAEILTDTIPTG